MVSPLQKPFCSHSSTGCPLARPETKGYKLSQQRPRSVQHAGMQPAGQSSGLLERGFGGIRQGHGAELCQGAPRPRPHPCLHSNQTQIQCALQISSCLKHVSPSPLPSLCWCQVSPRQGEAVMAAGWPAQSPLSRESRTGSSPRGAAASTDTSWLPFNISKPMLKASWCQGCGSQQPLRRALQVLCW